jgi:hypothetical protein
MRMKHDWLQKRRRSTQHIKASCPPKPKQIWTWQTNCLPKFVHSSICPRMSPQNRFCQMNLIYVNESDKILHMECYICACLLVISPNYWGNDSIICSYKYKAM